MDVYIDLLSYPFRSQFHVDNLTAKCYFKDNSSLSETNVCRSNFSVQLFYHKLHIKSLVAMPLEASTATRGCSVEFDPFPLTHFILVLKRKSKIPQIIVINLPRTYENLHCKGESYQFSG